MRIELRYDGASCILVPQERPSPRDLDAWASATAGEYVARRRDASEAGDALEADDRIIAERVASALRDIAAASQPDQLSMLIVGAGGRVLAPLIVLLAAEPLDPAEQAAFLWSPAALLPPAVEAVESDGLGAGVSVTLLERHGDWDAGFRRWLFLGANATVGAVLGPCAPYGLAFAAPIAEQVLRDSTAEEFLPSGDRARIAELVAAGAPQGESWPVTEPDDMRAEPSD